MLNEIKLLHIHETIVHFIAKQYSLSFAWISLDSENTKCECVKVLCVKCICKLKREAIKEMNAVLCCAAIRKSIVVGWKECKNDLFMLFWINYCISCRTIFFRFLFSFYLMLLIVPKCARSKNIRKTLPIVERAQKKNRFPRFPKVDVWCACQRRRRRWCTIVHCIQIYASKNSLGWG